MAVVVMKTDVAWRIVAVGNSSDIMKVQDQYSLKVLDLMLLVATEVVFVRIPLLQAAILNNNQN